MPNQNQFLSFLQIWSYLCTMNSWIRPLHSDQQLTVSAALLLTALHKSQQHRNEFNFLSSSVTSIFLLARISKFRHYGQPCRDPLFKQKNILTLNDIYRIRLTTIIYTRFWAFTSSSLNIHWTPTRFSGRCGHASRPEFLSWQESRANTKSCIWYRTCLSGAELDLRKIVVLL